MNFEILMTEQWYVLYLAIVMIVSGYVKDLGLLIPLYKWISENVKSNRMVIFLLSFITGVLPIPGRVVISAGVLNTIAPEDKEKRKIYGIIDYLSTHHYYLWSPLEKSVIIPIATLGLTYWGFINYMLPILIIAFVVIFYFVFVILKEDDVQIDLKPIEINRSINKNPLKYLNFYSLFFLFFVIAWANYIKIYTNEFYYYVEYFSNSFGLVSVIAFMTSLLLGSSSRFAAITSICTGIFGIQYLPWFFAIDYAGYMLSPTHKCFYIGKSYFDTDLKDYIKSILILTISIILVSMSMTFL
jgi:hypothetical protein